ncbi:hypothetical protein D3C76_1366760 [compost metagenome]
MILAGIALLELLLQQAQLTQCAAILGQQAFVVAVQLGNFVLAHQGALLCLAQLHLQLLHLTFVAVLLLLALLLDRIAIVLKGVSAMQVFLFERANLLVLVFQAQFEIRQCLAQPGIAGLLALKL